MIGFHALQRRRDVQAIPEIQRHAVTRRGITSRGWTTAMSGIVQRGIGVFRAHVGASTHALAKKIACATYRI